MAEEQGQYSKSEFVRREEEILGFWQEKRIFEKTLAKRKPGGFFARLLGRAKEFVFYEGPPTANGRPGIHHLEARAFKDTIPRYQTMQGFHVRRKGGWDTHGLPVELQVEKELGLKSKKDIERFGIAAFNTKCRESVWKYVREWETFTNRMGFWVDLRDPYVTYKNEYIEAVWRILKHVNRRGLLYKDYKVVPWCPRCGTALSSHELAQGYQDVKDLALTVKFKIKNPERLGLRGNVYLLAWTTTPWTLPGNVALAVGNSIEYVVNIKKDGTTITSKQLWEREWKKGALGELGYMVKDLTGDKLVGLEYEPLFPFLKENIPGTEKEKLANAFKVYAADFVTTEEGTGIVHTAVMYGQDDFELGTKVGLPKYHLVHEDGTFKPKAGFLAGKFVKDEATDVAIIKDLAERNLLFAKEKHTHSYPFCWRCKTPLIYFARDSWYIRMSTLRDKLVSENKKIHWEPEYIKEGRFGEWLHDIKDWAISRERYWGTPLPIWVCGTCNTRRVAGSTTELGGTSRNRYFVMRHGEAENNVRGVISSRPEVAHHLTERGKDDVGSAARRLLSGRIDLVFVSPFPRARETAKIIANTIKISPERVIVDDRIREGNFGSFDGKLVNEYHAFFSSDEERYTKRPPGGETYLEMKRRMGEFIYDVDQRFYGKNILIITHDSPAWQLFAAASGADTSRAASMRGESEHFIQNAEVKKLSFMKLPHNSEFELDLHRPFIDEVKLACDCGGEMTRVKEVLDVWFDSGAMPFAQDAQEMRGVEHQGSYQNALYPADFISEAIDQTRGWFYTLHAIGVLMGRGRAYKNVICLGHILDKEGKKMSKSVGNVVDPFQAMEKYGADPLRFWMYSVNQPGESKNFDENTVEEVVKKVFNLASNVLQFYLLYADSLNAKRYTLYATHVLDRWITARLEELVREVTDGLKHYKFLEPTRAIREFIADLSQWYLRRSRDRFKFKIPNSKSQINSKFQTGDENDKQKALATFRYTLLTLSKVMAPFTPFFAEHVYQAIHNANAANGGNANTANRKESVHLEDWPEIKHETPDAKRLLTEMREVRRIVSLTLEQRAAFGIKVRQPLAELRIRDHELGIKDKTDLLDLIKDEVNVKEVVCDASIQHEVELDMNITPELKKEGDLREILRTIQELRKEKGLKPGQMVVLKTSGAIAATGLLQEFEPEVKKTTSLSEIKHGGSSAGDFELAL